MSINWIKGGELLARLILASLCGMTIGIERSKRLKEAGVRTHCMVACGAALMMIVSKYGFEDLVSESGALRFGITGVDGSRIAAQVISGIGFLGAGVIVRTERSIKGLTTAAGLWTTSAVGLALGAGMYFIGVTGTVLIVAEQSLMHRFHIGNDAYTTQQIQIRFQDVPGFRERFFRMLEDRGGTVCNCSAERTETSGMDYTLVLRIRTPISAEEMQELMDQNEAVISFSI